MMVHSSATSMAVLKVCRSLVSVSREPLTLNSPRLISTLPLSFRKGSSIRTFSLQPPIRVVSIQETVRCLRLGACKSTSQARSARLRISAQKSSKPKLGYSFKRRMSWKKTSSTFSILLRANEASSWQRSGSVRKKLKAWLMTVFNVAWE